MRRIAGSSGLSRRLNFNFQKKAGEWNRILLLTNARPLSTAAVLDVENIPQPRPDSKSFEPPNNTHVELLMSVGGPHRLTDFVNELYKVNDVVQYRFPGAGTSVVIFDPEEMMKVHKASGPTPIGSAVSIWPMVEYYNKMQNRYKGVPMALTLDPSGWKKLRHALQKGLFGYDDAKSYIPLIAPVARDAVELLPANGHDTYNFLNRTTFELIHSVLYGKRTNVLDLAKAKPEDMAFVNSTQTSLQLAGLLLLHPMGNLIPNLDTLPKEYAAQIPPDVMSAWQQFCDSMEAIIDFGAKRFQEMMTDGELAKYTSETSTAVKPLAVRYVMEGDMNQDELYLNVAGILQGGVDTTANTILWCLTRLAQNPAVQQKLRAEARAAKPDRDMLWTAETLDKLKLLNSFIDETMRIVPTAGGHRRRTIEDCEVVSHRTGKTYRIPKGTLVMFFSQNMQNDPKFVSNPDAFDLSRYTRECKHARRGTPQAKIDHPIRDVFSFGPRMCIGARLARVELVNLLAEVVDKLNVEFADPEAAKQMAIFSALLTRPDPLPTFKFTKV